jgi:hypothetical protein
MESECFFEGYYIIGQHTAKVNGKIYATVKEKIHKNEVQLKWDYYKTFIYVDMSRYKTS